MTHRNLNPAAFANPRPGVRDIKRKSPGKTERNYVDTREAARQQRAARVERERLATELLEREEFEFVSALGNRFRCSRIEPERYELRVLCGRDQWIECGWQSAGVLRVALREARELGAA